LLGHQEKGKLLVLPRLDPPPSAGEYGRAIRWMCRGNTRMGDGREWGLMDRKPGRGITFEI